MAIELNRQTFRRLVQLYLICVVLLLVATAYEDLSPGWSAFSDDFLLLSEKHFGIPNESLLIPIGAWLVGILVWSLASTIGLLWFKRWARIGLWASLVGFIPIAFVPGLYPLYSGPISDLISIVDMGLFGAILLLAYSRDHGAIWFCPTDRSVKENSND